MFLAVIARLSPPQQGYESEGVRRINHVAGGVRADADLSSMKRRILYPSNRRRWLSRRYPKHLNRYPDRPPQEFTDM